jgi:hypothetical protein
VPLDAAGVIFHHANGAPLQVTQENCALLVPSPIADDNSIRVNPRLFTQNPGWR